MASSDGEDENSTRTHIPLGPGVVFGHYRIIEKIGAGGMGEVYLADDTKLDRRIALKFLPTHFVHNTDIRARFIREAQAAARLEHPNIVTIYEVGEFNDKPFFAMQYIEGKTLNQYCQGREIAIGELISLVAQISDGLGRAHSLGVVHRDIKSANIVVDRDLRPKILDFGLATIQGGEMLTKAGSTLGTVAYMSPEQAQGFTIDYRSDLFSLGVVLYELIAGRTPFKRDSDPATLHAIVNEVPEPLARYKSDVLPELERVISKSLAKKLADRYQSAADFSTDLRSVGRLLDSGGSMSSGEITASRPSIAVLPFANMSADPDNEYFSDGLTEELLNVLAKNPELKVTARTSSFAFKGKHEDTRGIGRQLGVGSLLEGSVRKSGNRVRIAAQLVSTADGFHLWSETYDRELDDIFAVQDEIALAVATAMKVTLFGQPSSSRSVNPESYSMVLRAYQSALQMTKSGLGVAVDLYQKSIDLDPSNARAWAGLAISLGRQAAFGHADYNDVYARARDAKNKALALDVELPAAFEAAGFILGTMELRFSEAGAALRRAHLLAPNDSRIVGSLALFEGICGRFEEALRLSKLAIELDPLNPAARLDRGRILLWADRPDDARDTLNKALDLSPDIVSGHLLLSWVALLSGEFDKALAETKKEVSAGYRSCGLALVYHALGESKKSDKALADLMSMGGHWGFQLACVHAYRGELDEAFEWLERSIATRDSGIPSTKVHPILSNLVFDHRWPELLRKIGLTV